MFPTVCGLYCDDCEHFEEDCPGCSESDGSVFWTEYVEISSCPVYECCVTQKNLPHCGHCKDLICERFTRFKDPDMSEEDLKKSLAKQKNELIRRLEDTSRS